MLVVILKIKYWLEKNAQEHVKQVKLYQYDALTMKKNDGYFSSLDHAGKLFVRKVWYCNEKKVNMSLTNGTFD